MNGKLVCLICCQMWRRARWKRYSVLLRYHFHDLPHLVVFSRYLLQVHICWVIIKVIIPLRMMVYDGWLLVNIATIPSLLPFMKRDSQTLYGTFKYGLLVCFALWIGGYNTAWSQLTSCTAYAPSLNKWVDMPSLNVARSQSTIAVWKGSFQANNFHTSTFSFWCYALVWIDGRIFMFGGFTLEGSLDSVEMFDITQWKWKNMKKLPITTALAAAVVVHDGILLLGRC